MKYSIFCPQCGHMVCECENMEQAADYDAMLLPESDVVLPQDFGLSETQRSMPPLFTPAEPCAMPFPCPSQESGPLWPFPPGEQHSKPKPCPPEKPCPGPKPCPPEKPCPGPKPCPPEKPCPDPKPCPPDKVCPPGGICNTAFAQLGLISNGASGSFITVYETKQAGNLVEIRDNTELLLSPGYVYYVSYMALATPEINSYFQMIPYLNDAAQLSYGTFAPTNGVWRNASAAGSFLVTQTLQAQTSLKLQLIYSNAARNIDLSGGMSIFPVAVPEI